MNINELHRMFRLLKKEASTKEEKKEVKTLNKEFRTNKRNWHKEFGKDESIIKLSDEYSHLGD